MADVIESPIVNGRQFKLTVRQTEEEQWVAWVNVPGQETDKNSTASFTGLSDGQVRQQAKDWMRDTAHNLRSSE